MATKPRRGIGEAIGSLICFFAVLGTLIALDDRARERVSLQLSGAGLASWTQQARSIASVVLEAAHDQSIEHTPLLIFSVVAVVLVLFMLRT